MAGNLWFRKVWGIELPNSVLAVVVSLLWLIALSVPMFVVNSKPFTNQFSLIGLTFWYDMPCTFLSKVIRGEWLGQPSMFCVAAIILFYWLMLLSIHYFAFRTKKLFVVLLLGGILFMSTIGLLEGLD